MYHMGKVAFVLNSYGKDVIAADRATQAVVEMWDNNQVILFVEAVLANEIKKGDIVLVDYRPIKGINFPAPEHKIVKILRGKLAQDSWKLMRGFYEKREKSKEKKEAAAGFTFQQQPMVR